MSNNTDITTNKNVLDHINELFNIIRMTRYHSSRSKAQLGDVQVFMDQLEMLINKAQADNPADSLTYVRRHNLVTVKKQFELHKAKLGQRIKYVEAINTRNVTKSRQVRGFAALLDILADTAPDILAERHAARVQANSDSKEIAAAKLAASLPITLFALTDSQASKDESAKQEQETLDILRRAELERQTPEEVAQQQLDEMHALLSDCPVAQDEEAKP